MPDVALEVRNLSVSYSSDAMAAVHGVSFDIAPGEVVALVGRSGAGKSSIIAAVMDLLPAEAKVTGSITVNGKDKAAVRANEWRGRLVGLVPQNPFSWFNPLVRVRKQLREVVAGEGRVRRSDTRDRADRLLQQVGFRDVARVGRARPGALSGGMCQRVAIAAAIAHKPPVVLADEPTSALDAKSQDQVLELLRKCKRMSQAVLLVSHEEDVVRELADRVLYLEGGRLVKELTSPASSLPLRLPLDTRERRLSAYSLGVAFPDHPLVDGFDLVVHRGETVAIVGESGRGKTTLCRVIAGQRPAQAGYVSIDGDDVSQMPRLERAKTVQMLFQDVRASLDERFTAHESVRIPLKSLGFSDIDDRISWAFDVAGVPTSLRRRNPAQLSGGEVQRIALARALSVKPRVLILDEPFSALDVKTRDELVSRLVDVQSATQMSIVAVLHNDEVVHGFAHRVIDLR